MLTYILKDLRGKIDGLGASAVVSKEGLIVASDLVEGVSEMHVAAMSAILLSTCENVLIELKKGTLDVCIVQGSDGKFIIMDAGMDFILVCVLDNLTRMDLAFVEMRNTARRIAESEA
ncbi:MAG: roadblock/LC7 domain-containing protein [Candidatus Hodarchaeota archaeon]